MSQVENVTQRFQSFVGAHEGSANGHWNNDIRNIHGVNFAEVFGMNFVAWCDIGFWVCFKLEGLEALIPKSASCYSSIAGYQQVDRYSEYPAIGAQFFVSSGELPRGGAHTGFVVGYDDDHIQTVEFNTNDTGSSEGDGCYAKTRSRFGNETSGVYAYGYPNYAEGIVSADPKWASAPPAAPPASPPPDGQLPWVYVGQVNHAAAWDPPREQGARSYSWEQVLLVEKALAAEGLLAPQYVDGSFGTLTIAAYAAWQRSLGLNGADADGKPGLSSLTKLGEKYGFRVGN
ncbi:hypothetical protein GCM10010193_44950 [Kitasatospora atroaurantiaca]|uniref:CHAP domain-containing protein n=1 Tax=Kitasatospora atroaurantiaca TaxID=285545 RepID=A0A561EZS9_9ACTN|nr:peptidoglycan-binding protein [Kitasatospora atroaurantiaca]TWE21123.1 hypothetical protein FB465_6290 [Kitasatospora atroaurantiaca]